MALHFLLTPELMEGDEAVVTCTSLIPGIYQQKVQTVLSTRPPHHASVMAAAPAKGKKIGKGIKEYTLYKFVSHNPSYLSPNLV